MFQFVLLSVTVLIAISIVNADEIKTIVETNSGPIRGKLFKTLFDQQPYYAFKGIPYAESPVNDLRFKVSCDVVYGC